MSSSLSDRAVDHDDRRDGPIPSTDPHPRRSLTVGRTTVHYADVGSGPLVLFLHGNPTSSYVWRNVLGPVSAVAQCVAPDLVGFGASDRRRVPTAAADQITHQAAIIDALVEETGVDRLVLVVQGWGSVIGLDWARRHPDRVRGLVHLEAVVRPLRWSDWPPPGRGLIAGMRSDAGEAMVLEENLLVEALLPTWIVREETDAELEAYVAPFRDAGQARVPMLAALRQLPLDGAAVEAEAQVAAYSAWMSVNTIPKLAILGDPGWLVRGSTRAHCRSWPNQVEVTVPGRHLLQEDAPDAIAAAIVSWLATLE